MRHVNVLRSDMPRTLADLHLTQQEIDLICEALDSHMYWQLSESQYRSSGFVLEPGSDDQEAQREIAACEELLAKLRVDS